MKIAPVVVWFNPDGEAKGFVGNIKTYSDCFEKVYIVDNSQDGNEGVASEIGYQAVL